MFLNITKIKTIHRDEHFLSLEAISVFSSCWHDLMCVLILYVPIDATSGF